MKVCTSVHKDTGNNVLVGPLRFQCCMTTVAMQAFSLATNINDAVSEQV